MKQISELKLNSLAKTKIHSLRLSFFANAAVFKVGMIDLSKPWKNIATRVLKSLAIRRNIISRINAERDSDGFSNIMSG